MASKMRKDITALVEQILEEPAKFDFFQLVRLLTYACHLNEQSKSLEMGENPVGYDADPAEEIIRFHTTATQSFPASSVSGAGSRNLGGTIDDSSLLHQQAISVVVSFMGLFGPRGVLPQHYTSLVLQRVRLNDHVLQKFLDLLGHRQVSLFFRVWSKYRPFIGYEQARVCSDDQTGRTPTDSFTESMFALVGMGSAASREHLSFDPHAILHFAPHFAQFRRPLVGLQQVLSEYFQLPVQVQPFVLNRQRLRSEDCCRLPSGEMPLGQNSQLGRTSVLGTRAWVVQGRIRIRIGPMKYHQFTEFWRGGRCLKELSELARIYAGPESDFEIEPHLEVEELPECRLKEDGDRSPRLGWNTWLRTGSGESDIETASFLVGSTAVMAME